MPQIHIPEISPIAAFAILSFLSFAAAVLCAIALFVSRRQYRRALEEAGTAHAERDAKWDSAVGDLSRRVDALSAEWHSISEQLSDMHTTASPRSGLNLTKRAQALRLHRRGDPPEQIAALLNLRRQEVDLLLKVHRLVLKAL